MPPAAALQTQHVAKAVTTQAFLFAVSSNFVLAFFRKVRYAMRTWITVRRKIEEACDGEWT